MRELSPRELAFLEVNLPEGESLEDLSPSRAKRLGRSRLSRTISGLLDYIPMAVGILTLLVAALATYLYIWGRDFFKVSDVQRLSNEGTLSLMDSTSGGWLTDTLQFFTIAPWIILAAVVFGILLMGLSMVLLGKRKHG